MNGWVNREQGVHEDAEQHRCGERGMLYLHSVRLVQHQVGHSPQVGRAALEMVNQTARGGDHYLHTIPTREGKSRQQPIGLAGKHESHD